MAKNTAIWWFLWDVTTNRKDFKNLVLVFRLRRLTDGVRRRLYKKSSKQLKPFETDTVDVLSFFLQKYKLAKAWKKGTECQFYFVYTQLTFFSRKYF